MNNSRTHQRWCDHSLTAATTILHTHVPRAGVEAELVRAVLCIVCLVGANVVVADDGAQLRGYRAQHAGRDHRAASRVAVGVTSARCRGETKGEAGCGDQQRLHVTNTEAW